MPTPRKTTKKQTKAKVAEVAERPISEIPPVKIQNSTGLALPEDKAEKIAQAHVAGIAISEICRMYNTSHHTVAALIRNRADLVERAAEICGKNWATAAAIGSAEALAALEHMRPGEKSVFAAIAMEKMLLARGQPTQRIEHLHKPAADAWGDFVAGLRKSGDVVDVAFEPVSTETAPAQKAAELPPAVIEIETEPLQ